MANPNPVSGIKNLQPVKTKEEARKRGQAGGIASGIAKQKNKLYKEAIEKQIGKSLDDIVSSVIKKALKGDIKANEFLRDSMNQKPKEEIRISGNVGETINKLDELMTNEREPKVSSKGINK